VFERTIQGKSHSQESWSPLLPSPHQRGRGAGERGAGERIILVIWSEAPIYPWTKENSAEARTSCLKPLLMGFSPLPLLLPALFLHYTLTLFPGNRALLPRKYGVVAHAKTDCFFEQALTARGADIDGLVTTFL